MTLVTPWTLPAIIILTNLFEELPVTSPLSSQKMSFSTNPSGPNRLTENPNQSLLKVCERHRRLSQRSYSDFNPERESYKANNPKLFEGDKDRTQRNV